MITREEHLENCKRQAREYLAQHDVKNAIATMMSELSKHPETEHANSSLMALGLMYAMQNDLDGARRFIEGFR